MHGRFSICSCAVHRFRGPLTQANVQQKVKFPKHLIVSYWRLCKNCCRQTLLQFGPCRGEGRETQELIALEACICVKCVEIKWVFTRHKQTFRRGMFGRSPLLSPNFQLVQLQMKTLVGHFWVNGYVPMWLVYLASIKLKRTITPQGNRKLSQI